MYSTRSAVSEVLLPGEMRHDVSAYPCNVPGPRPHTVRRCVEFQGFLMRHVPLFFGDVSLCVCVCGGTIVS